MFPPAAGPEVGPKNDCGTRGLAMQWAEGNGRGALVGALFRADWLAFRLLRLAGLLGYGGNEGLTACLRRWTLSKGETKSPHATAAYAGTRRKLFGSQNGRGSCFVWSVQTEGSAGAPSASIRVTT